MIDFSCLGFFKHREHHFELLQILEIELGDVVFRNNQSGFSYDYTINSIRQTGKTLLITYHNELIARGEHFFVIFIISNQLSQELNNGFIVLFSV